MERKQLITMAGKGKAMPDGLSFPEKFLFQSLRCLYKTAMTSEMDPEQGKKEKEQILAEFEKMRTKEIEIEKRELRWKEIEASSHRFVEEKSYDAALDFYKAVYGGVGLKDESPKETW